jgi:hypothetical protein
MPIEIGIGRLQPLVRVQHAGKGKASDAGDFTSLDAQLGYIIDGFHARLLGVYQYAKVQGQSRERGSARRAVAIAREVVA